MPSKKSYLSEMKTPWKFLASNGQIIPLWNVASSVSEIRMFIKLAPTPSLPDLLCDPTDLIWRKGTPFEVMIGRTALSSDGHLAEIFRVFLSRKVNAKKSVHSPQDHFIITLIISDRRDWRDTRGKWPLARNPDRSWWHRHTSLKIFWPQRMAPCTTGLWTSLI